MNPTIDPILFREIDKVYCKLTAQEELLLIKRAQSGCVRSRKKLVESQLPAIKKIANAYVRTNSRNEIGDLFSEGSIGLIKAIEHFDTSYGWRLYTFAQKFIINEIRDFSVDNHNVRNSRSKSKSRKLLPGEELTLHPDEIEIVNGVKRKKAEIFGCVNLDAPVKSDDPSGLSIHEVLADANASADDLVNQTDLAKVIQYFKPSDRLFIERHFGLNGHEATSLADLGKECVPEVTRQTMSKRLGELMKEAKIMFYCNFV